MTSARPKKNRMIQRHASATMKSVLKSLDEAFPCGMAAVGDDGAWVYVKDYEAACRHLKAAMLLAGIKR